MPTIQAINDAASRLRLLMFEHGLELTPLQLDFFLSKARRETLSKLRIATQKEGLYQGEIKAYCPETYLLALKKLVAQAKPASRFWAWQQLCDELNASVINLALYYAFDYMFSKSLEKSEHRSLWQWSLAYKLQHERAIFFEQWGSEGHPYHPNAKAKMGFSTRETLAYSPEFQTKFSISWLAISRRCVRLSGENICQHMNDAFPEAMANWKERLAARGFKASHYYPLPIHPWQLTHTLPDMFKEFFSENLLVDVDCQMMVTPTMSFRTVSNLQKIAPHIKLATAVHTTSAMRTVSPGSVFNGPRISTVFQQILTAENHFNHTLFVLKDLGGIATQHTNGKHLSALLRQNPCDYLEDDETAIALAALFKRSPISHKPLIVEIFETSNLSLNEFFHHYCEMLLPGQTTLFLKYGIALEAHQQNTFVVFDSKGFPKKHLNRDLGGIRLYRPRLKRRGYLLAIDKSVMIDTDDFNEVNNKFIHANLQSHLAYVISALSHHVYGANEKHLWKVVSGILENILIELKSFLTAQEMFDARKILFREPWQLKSLLRMRLEPCQGNYLYREIANPLIESSS